MMIKYNQGKYFSDSGDLIQTIIIMAAMAMVGIMGISVISEEISEQGSKQADCMASNSSFITVSYQNDCGQLSDNEPFLVITP